MSRLSSTIDGWRSFDSFAAEGLISGLDPRTIILSALCTVIAMTGAGKGEVMILLPLTAFPLTLLVLADIPFMWLVKRILPVLPFALMIGLLNPWLEQGTVTLPGGAEISTGWFTLASITLRALISAATALLLIASVGLLNISRGLAGLKVPALFITQLQMLFRYFFVIGEEFQRMERAWRLRSGSRRGRMPLKLAAQLLQNLFLRSLARAGRIHNAMLARGFTGEVPAGAPLHWRLRDTVWLAGWAGFALLCRSNLPLLLGTLLTGQPQ